MDIIDELIENGSVTSRPALNVSLYDYSSSNSLRRSDMEDGVYIVQVVQGGAADKPACNKAIVSSVLMARKSAHQPK